MKGVFLAHFCMFRSNRSRRSEGSRHSRRSEDSHGFLSSPRALSTLSPLALVALSALMSHPLAYCWYFCLIILQNQHIFTPKRWLFAHFCLKMDFLLIFGDHNGLFAHVFSSYGIFHVICWFKWRFLLIYFTKTGVLLIFGDHNGLFAHVFSSYGILHVICWFKWRFLLIYFTKTGVLLISLSALRVSQWNPNLVGPKDMASKTRLGPVILSPFPVQMSGNHNVITDYP